jgi:aryl-alcohol dehydrogenase-like predicted oxidoreductase
MQHQLIFGTGGLHRLATPRRRQRAIVAALDAGFATFDLAPACGNGIDETEVDLALRGRRSGIRLNTKYGLAP